MTARRPAPPSPAASPGPDRGFFDLWSRIYDAPPLQWLAYWPVHAAVVRAVRPLRPRRVLDLGCGTGQLAARLRRELRGARVVGCDFSAGMLAQAARRSRRVAWVRGDAARLPFADGSFDAVVSTEAFHWFPDQRRALREIHRVLRPGGRLLVALINTPSPLVSDVFHRLSRLAGQPFYWPSRAQMRQRVEAAGFTVAGQRRILRPGSLLLLPAVLTEAERAGAPG